MNRPRNRALTHWSATVALDLLPDAGGTYALHSAGPGDLTLRQLATVPLGRARLRITIDGSARERVVRVTRQAGRDIWIEDAQ